MVSLFPTGLFKHNLKLVFFGQIFPLNIEIRGVLHEAQDDEELCDFPYYHSTISYLNGNVYNLASITDKIEVRKNL